MTTGTLIQEHYASAAARQAVEYRVLLPPGATGPSDTAGLPFVLHLHGARSSSASLEKAKPRYEAAWASGDLPPVVIGCPTTATPGGFYIDHAGQGGRWETLIADEFPAVIDERYGTRAALRAAHGASMGGYGVLKLVFADPVRWAVSAAMSPAIFPAETHEAAKPFATDTLGELNLAMAGRPPRDAATYAANTIYGRLRANAAAIKAAAPAIAIDVGAADELGLARGSEYLHAVLLELGIAHTYRSVAGGGHHDALADLRAYDAIRDLGRALRPRL